MKRILEVPALAHAILGWTISIFFAYTLSADNPSQIFWISMTILPFAMLSPIVAIAFEIFNYPVTRRYLWRLVASYLSLLLAFGNAYFLLILVEPRRFVGIHSPWTNLPGLLGREIHMNDVWITVVDCLHFSCVTITTVGYGDMHPEQWIAKLLTDCEILLGLALIAVGLGRYFQETQSQGKGSANNAIEPYS